MFFEEFEIGQKFYTQGIKISLKDIKEFAIKFDPLPLHLDEDYAKNSSIFDGIIASGFHTLNLVWSQFVKMNITGAEVIAGLGMDKISWKLPVYPDDTLSAEIEVINLIPSKKGNKGTLLTKVTAYNQKNKTILTFEVSILMKGKSYANPGCQ